MYAFIFLTCNNCQHQFDVEMGYGCLKNQPFTTCPNCNNPVTVSDDGELPDGWHVLTFHGATRGLYTEIHDAPLPDFERNTRQ